MHISTFRKILEVAASNPLVKKEVQKNYWENQWWPLSVNEWRLRILFAGLSTRVSYHSIQQYQLVRDHLTRIGYQGLKSLDKSEFLTIVKSLGLGVTRWNYWRSVREFCEKYPDSDAEPLEIQRLSNDEAILLIKTQIKGAGYKVAQCSTLYMRGYHCGIIPIDSGMKEMMGPCLGFRASKGTIGHEIMRKQVEDLAKHLDYPKLLTKAGYHEILSSMEKGAINTWWVHLVLIYYKRTFCNRHDVANCPLAGATELQADMQFSCMKGRS